VGALLRRLSLALGSIDGELALKQHSIGIGVIPLGKKPHDWHWVLECPCSGGVIPVHKEV